MIRQLAPRIIPIFLNHQGCPHRCIFCNQDPITGTGPRTERLTDEDIATEINAWLDHPVRGTRPVQVAFYGGSFTGLPRDLQSRYLLAVQPFIKSGKVAAIRLSTRPDYILPTTPTFLKDFGVTTVELGIQSLNQKVLDRSLRGHTPDQSEQAIALVKQAGLTVGAQMMIGLPGETTATALAGINRLARLHPDFVRLYPALVIKGSGLEKLYRQGSYHPLSPAKAVILSGRITRILDEKKIPVIRIGLQPNPALEAGFVAGPYHPAFGELVKAWLLFDEIRRQLANTPSRPCHVIVAERDRSLLTGHGGKYLRRLQRYGLSDQVRIVYRNSGVERGKVHVEKLP